MCKFAVEHMLDFKVILGIPCRSGTVALHSHWNYKDRGGKWDTILWFSFSIETL